MTDPEINFKGAVDLDQVRMQKTREEAAQRLTDEAEAVKRQEYLAAQAAKWERSMRRAFKGIHRHSTRKRMLSDAEARDDS